MATSEQALKQITATLALAQPATLGQVFMQGTITDMDKTRRNELTRALAYIDQTLANAEDVAADPQDECQHSAQDFLIEFKDAKRRIESKLEGE